MENGIRFDFKNKIGVWALQFCKAIVILIGIAIPIAKLSLTVYQARINTSVYKLSQETT